MRKLLLIFFAFCFSVASAAQSVEVRVASQGEALGHSFIYINGRYVISADSAGVARIPVDRLQEGDALSASFVGAHSDPVRYAGQEKVALRIKTGHEIEEVVVVLSSVSVNMLRKYTRLSPSARSYEIQSGDFRFSHGGEELSSGRFGYLKSFPDSMVATKIYSCSDSATIRPLKALLPSVMELAIAATEAPQVAFAGRAAVRYMGVENRKHLFFISVRSYDDDPDIWVRDYQVLLKVDIRTKRIVEASVSSVVKNSSTKSDLSATFHTDKTRDRIFPASIEARMSSDNGITGDRFELDINKTEISGRVYPERITGKEGWTIGKF